MRKLFLVIFGLLFLNQLSYSAETKSLETKAPKIKLETTLGNITIQLNPNKAPISTDNFLGYVNDGFYAGTIFHRVIKDFMAQGGGFTTDYEQKPTKDPIKNEADNGLKNNRGTIAMARTPDPNSATAQFFINYSDNQFLDFTSPTPQGWGYAVFGEVIEGMEVVDQMTTIPTGSSGPLPSDVPQTPIVINKATVLPE